jgi:hypothetical protein
VIEVGLDRNFYLLGSFEVRVVSSSVEADLLTRSIYVAAGARL